MDKVAAEDVIRAPVVYKRMLKTVRVGDIRMNEVSYLIAPSGQADPVWAKRMASYWMLQELTYGLRLTDFTIVVDYPKGTIRSYAGVLDILPGERTDAESWELNGHATCQGTGAGAGGVIFDAACVVIFVIGLVTVLSWVAGLLIG